MENILYFLILFPFVSAVLQAFCKKNNARRAVTYISAGLIIVLSVAFCAWWFFAGGAEPLTLLSGTGVIDGVILLGEAFLMVLIFALSAAHKKYYVMVLSAVQTLALIWFELAGEKKIPGFEPSELTHLYVDRLTVIMILIVGVIGSLITVYACGYMVDYHRHHTDVKDRRPFFFSMMYVFLGAMFGLILSSSLTWMYFFWEITSTISFLLIGYTQTPEAIKNSFRALWMNLLGGCGFCAAIIWLSFYRAPMLGVYGISDLRQLIELGSFNQELFAAPVILLGFAALTKSAQMPFSSWLLGAMVAPTPSSALLHSATMVKAGVYLLIRIAPVMHGTTAGNMIAIIGGFTFFVTSLLAITVTDGKKVLAYSTISNLGLITACAGLGTNETIWAAVLLMIFHAVSKSLLFQTVGAIENLTGSRDIEDMHSLIIRYPKLAYPLIIGIAGMFLAPFGMLISKWAALESFIDADNKLLGITLVLFICFGSATTMYYWGKWLAKVLSYKPESTVCTRRLSNSQFGSILFHCAAMLALCLTFPIVSREVIIPYVKDVFGTANEMITRNNVIIMLFMLITVFVIPVITGFVVKSSPPEHSGVYIGGYNTGDDLSFYDSFKQPKRMYLSNWYLTGIIGEKKLSAPTTIIAAAAIVIMMAYTIGGAL